MIIFHPIYYIIAWPLAHVYRILESIFATDGARWFTTFCVLATLFSLIFAPLHIKKIYVRQVIKAITPQVRELGQQYKHDREQLNYLTMKLYQKHGVNPLDGFVLPMICLVFLLSSYGLFQIISRPITGRYRTVFAIPVTVVQSFQNAHFLGIPITIRLISQGAFAPANVRPVIIVSILIGVTVTLLNIGLARRRGSEIPGSTIPAIAYTLVAGFLALQWPLALIWQITMVNFLSMFIVAVARQHRSYDRSTKLRTRPSGSSYSEPISEQYAFGTTVRSIDYGKWNLWIQIAAFAVAIPGAVLALLALLR